MSIEHRDNPRSVPTSAGSGQSSSTAPDERDTTVPVDDAASLGRRSFLQRVGTGAAAAVTVGTLGIPAAKATGKPARGARAAKEPAQAASSGLHEGYRNIEEVWGPNYAVQPHASKVSGTRASSLPVLLRWNQIAIDASGLDHTPVAPGEDRVFGEQVGPCRASRAMAIVHVAMFEALNSIKGKYQSLVGMYEAPAKTNKTAAIAQAAHDALVALFPSQKAHFDIQLGGDLNTLPNNKSKSNGIAVGKTAALAALGRCYNDGSAHAEPQYGVNYIASDDPGKWRQDPISEHPLALGADWYHVRPLVLTSADQFRLPAPPALNSAAYAIAYDEVKRLGGDGITTPTERTPDQTEAGIYWAYDGTPSLCAPPRLYNQIATQIADQMNSKDHETARLLALVNVAMCDAGIASWDSKYFHSYWRPVTGIRESDPGTGPSGLGDGNPTTIGDTTYSPLGAPASNLTGPNFTPPFPAYPSGHATFGGALFQTLRRVYGTDNVTFTFVSDEYNGVTLDNQGNPRPLIPRTFNSFSQAEEENGQSRIYLGIHWSFDKTGGITQGRQVADWVFDHAFKPV
jgi:hypothetical protein